MHTAIFMHLSHFNTGLENPGREVLMNVLKRRALILILLVLCLFGLTILGASAAVDSTSATTTQEAGSVAKVDKVSVAGAAPETYYYTDLATAIAEADDGATVTLLGDVTLAEKLTVTQTVTLDLSGYKLTLATVEDNYAVVIKGAGHLTITGNGAVDVPGPFGFGLTTDCTGGLTIENGTFTQADNGSYLIGAYNGSVVIENGSFTVDYCVVNAFKYTAGGSTVSGSVTVQDGSFTVTNTTDNPTASPLLVDPVATASVEGGTYTGISEYALEVLQQYSTDDFTVNDADGDGVYTLNEGEAYLASTDSYMTFAEAWAAAQDGDTIIILKDIALTQGFTLEGKKLTVTSADGVTVDASALTAALFTLTSSADANAELTLENLTFSISQNHMISVSTATVGETAHVVNMNNVKATAPFVTRSNNAGVNQGALIVLNNASAKLDVNATGGSFAGSYFIYIGTGTLVDCDLDGSAFTTLVLYNRGAGQVGTKDDPVTVKNITVNPYDGNWNGLLTTRAASTSYMDIIGGFFNLRAVAYDAAYASTENHSSALVTSADNTAAKFYLTINKGTDDTTLIYTAGRKDASNSVYNAIISCNGGTNAAVSVTLDAYNTTFKSYSNRSNLIDVRGTKATTEGMTFTNCTFDTPGNIFNFAGTACATLKDCTVAQGKLGSTLLGFANDTTALTLGYPVRVGTTEGGKIGAVYFANLPAAITAAQDGDTITLLANASLGTATTLTKPVTITAVPGVTLTLDKVLTVGNGGTLTLSSLNFTWTVASALTVSGGGTLNITGTAAAPTSAVQTGIHFIFPNPAADTTATINVTGYVTLDAGTHKAINTYKENALGTTVLNVEGAEGTKSVTLKGGNTINLQGGAASKFVYSFKNASISASTAFYLNSLNATDADALKITLENTDVSAKAIATTAGDHVAATAMSMKGGTLTATTTAFTTDKTVSVALDDVTLALSGALTNASKISATNMFATDAEAAAAGFTVRTSETEGGTYYTIYAAMDTIPTGGTGTLYLAGATTLTSEVEIHDKNVTIVGRDDIVNDGNYDLIRTGSGYAFAIYSKGTLTFKNMCISSAVQLVDFNANKTVEGAKADKDVTINIENTWATVNTTSGVLIGSRNHFATDKGGCGEQADTAILNVDASSKLDFTTSNKNVWVISFNHNSHPYMYANIDGEITVHATHAELADLTFVRSNNPNLTEIVLSASAQVTLNADVTPASFYLATFSTASRRGNSRMFIHLDAITDDAGSSTLGGALLYHGSSVNVAAVTYITVPANASEAALATFAALQHVIGTNAAAPVLNAFRLDLENGDKLYANFLTAKLVELTPNGGTINVIADGEAGYEIAIANKKITIKSEGATRYTVTSTTIGTSPIFRTGDNAHFVFDNIGFVAGRFIAYEQGLTTGTKFTMEVINGSRLEAADPAKDPNFIYGGTNDGDGNPLGTAILFTVTIDATSWVGRPAYDWAKGSDYIFNLNCLNAAEGSAINVYGTLADATNFTATSGARRSCLIISNGLRTNLTVNVYEGAVIDYATSGLSINANQGMFNLNGDVNIMGGTFNITGTNVVAPFWSKFGTFNFSGNITFNAPNIPAFFYDYSVFDVNFADGTVFTTTVPDTIKLKHGSNLLNVSVVNTTFTQECVANALGAVFALSGDTGLAARYTLQGAIDAAADDSTFYLLGNYTTANGFVLDGQTLNLTGVDGVTLTSTATHLFTLTNGAVLTVTDLVITSTATTSTANNVGSILFFNDATATAKSTATLTNVTLTATTSIPFYFGGASVADVDIVGGSYTTKGLFTFGVASGNLGATADIYYSGTANVTVTGTEAQHVTINKPSNFGDTSALIFVNSETSVKDSVNVTFNYVDATSAGHAIYLRNKGTLTLNFTNGSLSSTSWVFAGQGSAVPYVTFTNVDITGTNTDHIMRPYSGVAGAYVKFIGGSITANNVNGSNPILNMNTKMDVLFDGVTFNSTSVKPLLGGSATSFTAHNCTFNIAGNIYSANTLPLVLSGTTTINGTVLTDENAPSYGFNVRITTGDLDGYAPTLSAVLLDRIPAGGEGTLTILTDLAFDSTITLNNKKLTVVGAAGTKRALTMNATVAFRLEDNSHLVVENLKITAAKEFTNVVAETATATVKLDLEAGAEILLPHQTGSYFLYSTAKSVLTVNIKNGSVINALSAGTTVSGAQQGLFDFTGSSNKVAVGSSITVDGQIIFGRTFNADGAASACRAAMFKMGDGNITLTFNENADIQLLHTNAKTGTWNAVVCLDSHPNVIVNGGKFTLAANCALLGLNGTGYTGTYTVTNATIAGDTTFLVSDYAAAGVGKTNSTTITFENVDFGTRNVAQNDKLPNLKLINVRFATEAIAAANHAVRLNDGNYYTLAEAVSAASAGATIYVVGDTAFFNTVTIPGKTLTIQGLTGNEVVTKMFENEGVVKTGYLFDIGSNSNVTFKNIKLVSVRIVKITADVKNAQVTITLDNGTVFEGYPNAGADGYAGTDGKWDYSALIYKDSSNVDVTINVNAGAQMIVPATETVNNPLIYLKNCANAEINVYGKLLNLANVADGANAQVLVTKLSAKPIVNIYDGAEIEGTSDNTAYSGNYSGIIYFSASTNVLNIYGGTITIHGRTGLAYGGGTTTVNISGNTVINNTEAAYAMFYGATITVNITGTDTVKPTFNTPAKLMGAGTAYAVNAFTDEGYKTIAKTLGFIVLLESNKTAYLTIADARSAMAAEDTMYLLNSFTSNNNFTAAIMTDQKLTITSYGDSKYAWTPSFTNKTVFFTLGNNSHLVIGNVILNVGSRFIRFESEGETGGYMKVDFKSGAEVYATPAGDGNFIYYSGNRVLTMNIEEGALIQRKGDSDKATGHLINLGDMFAEGSVINIKGKLSDITNYTGTATRGGNLFCVNTKNVTVNIYPTAELEMGQTKTGGTIDVTRFDVKGKIFFKNFAAGTDLDELALSYGAMLRFDNNANADTPYAQSMAKAVALIPEGGAGTIYVFATATMSGAIDITDKDVTIVGLPIDGEYHITASARFEIYSKGTLTFRDLKIYTTAQLVDYNANKDISESAATSTWNVVVNIQNTQVDAEGSMTTLVSSRNHYATNRGGCGKQGGSATVNIDKDSVINFTTSSTSNIYFIRFDHNSHKSVYANIDGQITVTVTGNTTSKEFYFVRSNNPSTTQINVSADARLSVTLPAGRISSGKSFFTSCTGGNTTTNKLYIHENAIVKNGALTLGGIKLYSAYTTSCTFDARIIAESTENEALFKSILAFNTNFVKNKETPDIDEKPMSFRAEKGGKVYYFNRLDLLVSFVDSGATITVIQDVAIPYYVTTISGKTVTIQGSTGNEVLTKFGENTGIIFTDYMFNVGSNSNVTFKNIKLVSVRIVKITADVKNAQVTITLDNGAIFEGYPNAGADGYAGTDGKWDYSALIYKESENVAVTINVNAGAKMIVPATETINLPLIYIKRAASAVLNLYGTMQNLANIADGANAQVYVSKLGTLSTINTYPGSLMEGTSDNVAYTGNYSGIIYFSNATNTINLMGGTVTIHGRTGMAYTGEVCTINISGNTTINNTGAQYAMFYGGSNTANITGTDTVKPTFNTPAKLMGAGTAYAVNAFTDAGYKTIAKTLGFVVLLDSSKTACTSWNTTLRGMMAKDETVYMLNNIKASTQFTAEILTDAKLTIDSYGDAKYTWTTTNGTKSVIFYIANNTHLIIDDVIFNVGSRFMRFESEGETGGYMKVDILGGAEIYALPAGDGNFFYYSADRVLTMNIEEGAIIQRKGDSAAETGHLLNLGDMFAAGSVINIKGKLSDITKYTGTATRKGSLFAVPTKNVTVNIYPTAELEMGQTKTGGTIGVTRFAVSGFIHFKGYAAGTDLDAVATTYNAGVRLDEFVNADTRYVQSIRLAVEQIPAGGEGTVYIVGDTTISSATTITDKTVTLAGNATTKPTLTLSANPAFTLGDNSHLILKDVKIVATNAFMATNGTDADAYTKLDLESGAEVDIRNYNGGYFLRANSTGILTVNVKNGSSIKLLTDGTVRNGAVQGLFDFTTNSSKVAEGSAIHVDGQIIYGLKFLGETAGNSRSAMFKVGDNTLDILFTENADVQLLHQNALPGTWNAIVCLDGSSANTIVTFDGGKYTLAAECAMYGLNGGNFAGTYEIKNGAQITGDSSFLVSDYAAAGDVNKTVITFRDIDLGTINLTQNDKMVNARMINVGFANTTVAAHNNGVRVEGLPNYYTLQQAIDTVEEGGEGKILFVGEITFYNTVSFTNKHITLVGADMTVGDGKYDLTYQSSAGYGIVVNNVGSLIFQNMSATATRPLIQYAAQDVATVAQKNRDIIISFIGSYVDITGSSVFIGSGGHHGGVANKKCDSVVVTIDKDSTINYTANSSSENRFIAFNHNTHPYVTANIDGTVNFATKAATSGVRFILSNNPSTTSIYVSETARIKVDIRGAVENDNVYFTSCNGGGPNRLHIHIDAITDGNELTLGGMKLYSGHSVTASFDDVRIIAKDTSNEQLLTSMVARELGSILVKPIAFRVEADGLYYYTNTPATAFELVPDEGTIYVLQDATIHTNKASGTLNGKTVTLTALFDDAVVTNLSTNPFVSLTGNAVLNVENFKFAGNCFVCFNNGADTRAVLNLLDGAYIEGGDPNQHSVASDGKINPYNIIYSGSIKGHVVVNVGTEDHPNATVIRPSTYTLADPVTTSKLLNFASAASVTVNVYGKLLNLTTLPMNAENGTKTTCNSQIYYSAGSATKADFNVFEGAVIEGALWNEQYKGEYSGLIYFSVQGNITITGGTITSHGPLPLNYTGTTGGFVHVSGNTTINMPDLTYGVFYMAQKGGKIDLVGDGITLNINNKLLYHTKTVPFIKADGTFASDEAAAAVGLGVRLGESRVYTNYLTADDVNGVSTLYVLRNPFEKTYNTVYLLDALTIDGRALTITGVETGKGGVILANSPLAAINRLFTLKNGASLFVDGVTLKNTASTVDRRVDTAGTIIAIDESATYVDGELVLPETITVIFNDVSVEANSSIPFYFGGDSVIDMSISGGTFTGGGMFAIGYYAGESKTGAGDSVDLTANVKLNLTVTGTEEQHVKFKKLLSGDCNSVIFINSKADPYKPATSPAALSNKDDICVTLTHVDIESTKGNAIYMRNSSALTLSYTCGEMKAPSWIIASQGSGLWYADFTDVDFIGTSTNYIIRPYGAAGGGSYINFNGGSFTANSVKAANYILSFNNDIDVTFNGTVFNSTSKAPLFGSESKTSLSIVATDCEYNIAGNVLHATKAPPVESNGISVADDATALAMGLFFRATVEGKTKYFHSIAGAVLYADDGTTIYILGNSVEAGSDIQIDKYLRFECVGLSAGEKYTITHTGTGSLFSITTGLTNSPVHVVMSNLLFTSTTAAGSIFSIGGNAYAIVELTDCDVNYTKGGVIVTLGDAIATVDINGGEILAHHPFRITESSAIELNVYNRVTITGNGAGNEGTMIFISNTRGEDGATQINLSNVEMYNTTSSGHAIYAMGNSRADMNLENVIIKVSGWVMSSQSNTRWRVNLKNIEFTSTGNSATRLYGASGSYVNIMGGKFSSTAAASRFNSNNGYAIANFGNGIEVNFYDGFIESDIVPCISGLSAGVTINIYGGTFNYNGSEAVSPIAIPGRSSINVFGGTFRSASRTAPVFSNVANTANSLTLNSYHAYGNANLITNLGAGTASAAHTGYCKSSFTTIVTTRGATPVLLDGVAGLGFKATLDANTYNYLKSIASEQELRFGMLIVPTALLPENAAFTHYGLANSNLVLGEDYFDVEAGEHNIELLGDGSAVITITYADITDYETAYSVVFYANMDVDFFIGFDASGAPMYQKNNLYHYSAYDKSENSRSLAQVARAAYNDNSDMQDEYYSNAIEDSSLFSHYTADELALLATLCGGDTAQKELDIFLVAGGSNAAGNTVYGANYADNFDQSSISSNVFYSGLITDHAPQTYGEQILHFTANKYTAIGTVPTLGMGWDEGTMGVEIGMAQKLSEYYNDESGKYAAIMKYAVNGSNLVDFLEGDDVYTGNWNSAAASSKNAAGKTSGQLYENFIQLVSKQISDYEAQGYKVNVVGMYWMQGEEDVAYANKYADAFQALVSDVREDLSAITGVDQSAMPVVIAEIANFLGLTTSEAHTAFINAQNALAQTIDADGILVSGIAGVTVDTTSKYAADANGIFVNPADLTATGARVIATLLTSGGSSLDPTVTDEIVIPVIENTTEVLMPDGTPWMDDNNDPIGFTSLVIAAAKAPAGSTIKLTADQTTFTQIVLSNLEGITLDGNGSTITVNSDEIGLNLQNANVTLKNFKLDHNGNGVGIKVDATSNVVIDGDSFIETSATAIELVGKNAKLEVKSGTFKTTGDNAESAIIRTSSAHVEIKGGTFEAATGAACIHIEKNAPAKLTVNVTGGSFKTVDQEIEETTSDGLLTGEITVISAPAFVNESPIAILVVDPSVEVDASQLMHNVGIGAHPAH